MIKSYEVVFVRNGEAFKRKVTNDWSIIQSIEWALSLVQIQDYAVKMKHLYSVQVLGVPEPKTESKKIREPNSCRWGKNKLIDRSKTQAQKGGALCY